jgi:hypothetical protein
MSKVIRSWLISSWLIWTGVTGAADETPSSPRTDAAPRQLDASTTTIGARIAEVCVEDLDGAPRCLSKLCGPRATVIAMTSGTCPLSRRFAPEISRLRRDFKDAGVEFVHVLPPGDSVLETRKLLQECGDSAPCLVDPNWRLSRVLQPSSSTEVFVLDADRVVRYRGAVSDQYGLGYSHSQATHHYLRDAIDAVVSGRDPVVKATSSPGCAIRQAPDEFAAVPETARSSEITYSRDIARILAANCLECHHAGGSAPFPLETYDQVWGKAPMIRRVVQDGIMPPWFAAPSAPGVESPWANDRTMSESDKRMLLRWIDDGAPAVISIPANGRSGNPI